MKLFQKTAYPKRYFTVDFTFASILIKNKKKDDNANPNNKVIAFREVLSVSKPTAEGEEIIKNKDCIKPWIYAFYV